MKKNILLALMTSTVLMSVPVFLFKAEPAIAQEDKKPDSITVDRVILSTSGLANLEHKAKVSGDTTLSFPVRLEQVDDILKSLVIFDRGGAISNVTLPGKQPVAEVFKDLPFTQDQLENPMMLLNAYQGATVTMKLPGSAEVSGKLLQVRPETAVINDKAEVTKHRVSVMTDTGIRQAVMEDLESIQFEDAKIREEIARALNAVRVNRTSGNRDLAVDLKGKGARDVSLAYVVEAPVWKTAYRLVMPPQSGKSGLLQGWAVIENMTAGDWNNVDLTLVSGNPVTFRQPLYQSYYISRPELPVQVFGRVMPRVDEGVISSAKEERAVGGAVPQMKAMARGNFAAAPAAAPAPMMEMAAAADMSALGDTSGYGSTADSLSTAAQATEGAEGSSQVMFHFPSRISLKAGQSMMLPFVSRDLKMEQVSLYQPDTNDKHPLAAVEVKNDGNEALPSGVLTLYEESDVLKGSAFVGDARLPALPSGEMRVVPYALDQKTVVSRENKTRSTEGAISISQGVLKTTVKQVQEVAYKIKAPAKEPRLLVIEQPKMGDFNLVEPEAKTVDETANFYRFRVPLKGGDEKEFTVRFERDVYQTLGLFDMSSNDLFNFTSSNRKIDDKTKKIFERLAEMRRAIENVEAQLERLEQQRQDIFTDQKRVRDNLKSLDGKSEIQQKYLDKLNAQEEQLGKIEAEKQRLTVERAAKEQMLRDEIAKIKI